MTKRRRDGALGPGWSRGGDPRGSINPYLPSDAARAFFTVTRDPADDLPRPGVGFAVLFGYAVVLLAVAAIRLVGRDV
jgi:hypothetical protein